jgi:hypothetical protein
MTKEEPQTFAATLKADIPPKIKSFEDCECVMRYVLVQFHLSHPIRNDLADAKVYMQADKLAQNQATNYILTPAQQVTQKRGAGAEQLQDLQILRQEDHRRGAPLAALLIKYYPV